MASGASESINLSNFSYSVAQKDLKIVVRGLYNQCETEEIMEDLKNKGFNPTKVRQMINKKLNKPMPLYVVSLPRSDKKIYELKTKSWG